MAPNLEGVDLKLGRADEHLSFLDHATDTFFKEPGPVTVEYEAATGDYVMRYGGEQPPPKWGLDVSEFAHMLRTALDNMLWQLILARGGTPIDKVTQFPIKDNPPDPKWQAGPPVPTNAQGDPWRGIYGVLPPDAAFIEGAQPYKLGMHGQIPLARWHPLSMLGNLNNIDKHRFILPAVAAGGFLASPLGSVFGGGVPIFLRDKGRFEAVIAGKLGPNEVTLIVDGKPETVVVPPGQMKTKGMPIHPVVNEKPATGTFRFDTDDPAEIMRIEGIGIPDAEVKVHPSPGLAISLSGIERPTSIHDLHQIRIRVGEIVDEFRPVFV